MTGVQTCALPISKIRKKVLKEAGWEKHLTFEGTNLRTSDSDYVGRGDSETFKVSRGKRHQPKILCSEKLWTQKDACCPPCAAALFTVVKTWIQPECINRWTDKDVVHICTNMHTGIVLSHKKKEMLALATTWKDLEGTVLSKISHTENGKRYVISLTCGI